MPIKKQKTGEPRRHVDGEDPADAKTWDETRDEDKNLLVAEPVAKVTSIEINITDPDT